MVAIWDPHAEQAAGATADARDLNCGQRVNAWHRGPPEVSAGERHSIGRLSSG
jgi:hypothetical protein